MSNLKAKLDIYKMSAHYKLADFYAGIVDENGQMTMPELYTDALISRNKKILEIIFEELSEQNKIFEESIQRCEANREELEKIIKVLKEVANE